MVPREFSVILCKDTHTYFDTISKKKSDQRLPDDLVSIEIFIKMNDIFERHRHIYDYVSKNLAHAAIPESRNLVHIDDIHISVREIWDSHRELYEIVDFLSKFLAGTFMQPLTIEDSEFYEFWDEPLIDSLDLPKLKAKFLEFRKETESWSLHNDINNWFRENAAK